MSVVWRKLRPFSAVIGLALAILGVRAYWYYVYIPGWSTEVEPELGYSFEHPNTYSWNGIHQLAYRLGTNMHCYIIIDTDPAEDGDTQTIILNRELKAFTSKVEHTYPASKTHIHVRELPTKVGGERAFASFESYDDIEIHESVIDKVWVRHEGKFYIFKRYCMKTKVTKFEELTDRLFLTFRFINPSPKR